MGHTIDVGLVHNQPAVVRGKRGMPFEQAYRLDAIASRIIGIAHDEHIGLGDSRIEFARRNRLYGVALALPRMRIFVVGQRSQCHPRMRSQPRQRLNCCLGAGHKQQVLGPIVFARSAQQRLDIAGQTLPDA